MHNPVHIVFSTKERHKLIPEDMKPKLWAYMAGVCKNLKIFVHEIGGMEDHAHMLIEILLTLAHSDAIEEIKTGSSRWMGSRFAWQRGFGLFGVSASNQGTVIRYIRNQEAHHKKRNYEEEFIALLEKHGVKYDPRYVFG